jgi:hypothetical protein
VTRRLTGSSALSRPGIAKSFMSMPGTSQAAMPVICWRRSASGASRICSLIT